MTNTVSTIISTVKQLNLSGSIIIKNYNSSHIDHINCYFDNTILIIIVYNNFIDIDYYKQFTLNSTIMMQSVWCKQNITNLDDIIEQLLIVVSSKNKIK